MTTQEQTTATLEAIPGGITTVPDQFIAAMREGLAARAVHDAVKDAVLTTWGATALHEDVKVHDLEQYLPCRRRARGTMSTAYVAPFAQYAISYAETGAAVFVDAEHMAATAVLDLGTKEVAGHADHRAKLAPVKTAAYAALLGVNGRRTSRPPPNSSKTGPAWHACSSSMPMATFPKARRSRPFAASPSRHCARLKAKNSSSALTAPRLKA